MTASPPFASPTAANLILLYTYNTVVVPAGQVLQLCTSGSPGAGPFYYNVLNLGSGTVYFSDSQAPVAGAPNVMPLPPNIAYNGMFIGEGARGVYVLGDYNGATLSLCLVQSIGVW